MALEAGIKNAVEGMVLGRAPELARSPDDEGVERAAVVAQSDDAGVAVAAFITMKPDHKKSIIAMKRHCTVYLPHYMVPDSITFLPSLPTTSTDKVDYQGLKRLVTDPSQHA